MSEMSNVEPEYNIKALDTPFDSYITTYEVLRDGEHFLYINIPKGMPWLQVNLDAVSKEIVDDYNEQDLITAKEAREIVKEAYSLDATKHIIASRIKKAAEKGRCTCEFVMGKYRYNLFGVVLGMWLSDKGYDYTENKDADGFEIFW